MKWSGTDTSSRPWNAQDQALSSFRSVRCPAEAELRTFSCTHGRNKMDLHSRHAILPLQRQEDALRLGADGVILSKGTSNRWPNTLVRSTSSSISSRLSMTST